MNSAWIDLTVPVSAETPVWPDDPVPRLTRIVDFVPGADFRLSVLNFGLHTGTHVDAPLHYIKGGRDVSKLDLWKMQGEVMVVDATIVEVITVDFLTSFYWKQVKRVFFKTFSNKVYKNEVVIRRPYRALDASAANWLAAQGIVLCGIDGLTIAIESQIGDAHHALLKNEVVVIEHLDLSKLTPGLYEMIALPMLIPGAEAAPARVLVKKSLQQLL